ncbi:SDR family oxidoreductase [Sphingosinicella microcystinivorans]|nr:SDR family oxidoreductase [Sphingosinicella microcystinivorans]
MGHDPVHKIAVVMGGGSSVGRGIAVALADLGLKVHVADIVQADLDDLAAARPDIVCRNVDAIDPVAVEACLQQIERTDGPVDVLINTVGIGGEPRPIEETTVAEWDRIIAGSAGAAFYAIRQVVPGMKARGGGCIINFSSCSTKVGLPLRTPYIAAKYALEGLTRNLARELGPYGIRVNAILPGAIDNDRFRGIVTKRAQHLGRSECDVEADLLAFVSMRTKIAIEEIVGAVLYLMSPAARHVTGQLLSVDGNVEWEN